MIELARIGATGLVEAKRRVLEVTVERPPMLADIHGFPLDPGNSLVTKPIDATAAPASAGIPTNIDRNSTLQN